MRSKLEGLAIAIIAAAAGLPLLWSTLAGAQVVDYDIVYTRYPLNPLDDPDGTTAGTKPLIMPQGEVIYDIAGDADLVLWNHDTGLEEVLVDCSTDCAVMDPFVGFGGDWAYYSLISGIDSDTDNRYNRQTLGLIYKINIDRSDPAYKTIVQLTFDEDDGFDSRKHAGYAAETPNSELGAWRPIRDMAPAPLADGRVVFTSNRGAIMMPVAGDSKAKDPHRDGSTQQLYIIDDHDGTRDTTQKSNLRKLWHGDITSVQHPFPLQDGRIMFTSWQDFGKKDHYANTVLFTIHPDGSNFQQFTEPHEHRKVVDHFATQISNGDIVAANYYPGFSYGFGVLLVQPLLDDLNGGNPTQPAHVLEPNQSDLDAVGDYSKREFNRIGYRLLTPHTAPGDAPSPNESGKYSYPQGAPGGDLIVAYSIGHVNSFDAACGGEGTVEDPYECENPKTGIYLIPDVASATITDPNQLTLIYDNPAYNEIWARPVVPWVDIYGESAPVVLSSVNTDGVQDDRLELGEPASIMGTASMYNRDDFSTVLGPENSVGSTLYRDSVCWDGKSQCNDDQRPSQIGHLQFRGTDAGDFTNEQIWGIRIIATLEKPWAPPTQSSSSNWPEDVARRCTIDYRYGQKPDQFCSTTNEKWVILGEFYLPHRGTTDGQGSPDTSWHAKLPADTPLVQQAIDENGMAIITGQDWRSIQPGEKIDNCGGCHAHAKAPLDVSTTQSGTRANITNVPGLSDSDPILDGELWDLTTGQVPLVDIDGANPSKIVKVPGRSYSVEYHRDIVPIIDAKCSSCHDGTTASPKLDTTPGIYDAYYELVANNCLTPTPGDWAACKYSPQWMPPQDSKYYRGPEARTSLANWVVWGERLDGRANGDRDDIDYTTAVHDAHSTLRDDQHANYISDAQKQTFSRWLDLGAPMDFKSAANMGLPGLSVSSLEYEYTDDFTLPVITLASPTWLGASQLSTTFRAGVVDIESGIDWTTLKASITKTDDTVVDVAFSVSLTTGIMKGTLPAIAAGDTLKIVVSDLAGNTETKTLVVGQ